MARLALVHLRSPTGGWPCWSMAGSSARCWRWPSGPCGLPSWALITDPSPAWSCMASAGPSAASTTRPTWIPRSASPSVLTHPGDRARHYAAFLMEDPMSLLDETVAAITPLRASAGAEARERQERLTKPSGSLGMLEDISAQLAGLAGECPPPLPQPAVIAGVPADHGVHAQGVTPWPQEVTAQMVANFIASGAVVNAIAAQTRAGVCVVDVGVATDLPPGPGLLSRKVRAGTADMTTGPPTSRAQAA